MPRVRYILPDPPAIIDGVVYTPQPGGGALSDPMEQAAADRLLTIPGFVAVPEADDEAVPRRRARPQTRSPEP